MTIPRALSWKHLFPADVSLLCSGAPPWFREIAGREDGHGHGKRVMIAWKSPPETLPDLDPFHGLVAVNSRRLSAARLTGAGFGYVRRFAVLPSLEHARWFIPLDGPAVSSGAFCLYSPLRRSARLAYLGVRGAARAGLPIWYRDYIVIAQRELPPIESVVQGLFPGQTVRLALSTGPEGPDVRRNVSAAILDRRGQPMAFAKLSGSGVSRRLLEHEAQILPALAALPGPCSLAPRLLFGGEIDGVYATIQTPVVGRPVGSRLTPAHLRLLDALRGREVKPAAATGMIGSLRTRLRDAPSPWRGLSEVLDRLTPTLERLAVPTTIVHTDFVPWNLREKGGVIAAFDWDAAELDGLPLYDELHHELIVGYLVKRWTVERASRHLQEIASSAPLGLPPGQVRALQAVYLIHFLLRLATHGHDEDDRMVVWYRRVLAELAADQVETKVACGTGGSSWADGTPGN